MSIEPYFTLFYNAFISSSSATDERHISWQVSSDFVYLPRLCIFKNDHKAKRKSKPQIIVWRLTMDMIKVSATSRTSAVAGAIAGVVREHHRAEVQAIGAGAVNQA